MIGRLFKVLYLRPRVKRMTWEQVAAGTWKIGTRFIEQVSGVNEEAAAVTGPSGKSVRDMVAHLTVGMEITTDYLEALRAGRSPNDPLPELWPNTEARAFAQTLADHRAALNRLMKTAERPVTSEATAHHDFFGPMSARELLAVVAFHYEYHTRQVDRLMRSEAFRKAQGAQW